MMGREWKVVSVSWEILMLYTVKKKLRSKFFFFFCKQCYLILDFLIESSKEQNYFNIEILFNIKNVFSVTFNQFNKFYFNKNVTHLKLLNKRDQ